MRELDLPDIADCTLCSISALSTRPAVSQWSYFLTASYDGKRNGLPTPADAPATKRPRGRVLLLRIGLNCSWATHCVM
jgi:hypothetical protein